MITPFKADGAVDYDGAEKLAVMLVHDGSDGVVVSGTTGESPSLSDAEKIGAAESGQERDSRQERRRRHRQQRHPSLSRAVGARDEGGRGCPARGRPLLQQAPQDGMYQHFQGDLGGRPDDMYNIQGRTAVNMTAATTLRCAELPGIIGVKEASGDLDQIGLVCAGKPDQFRVWSGDDSWTLSGHGRRRLRRHLRGVAHRRAIDGPFDRGLPQGRKRRGARYPPRAAAGDQDADDDRCQPGADQVGL